LQWKPWLAALAAGAGLLGCNRVPQPTGMPPPEVAVVTIQPRSVLLTTELPGRTCAYRVAEIRPQVNGLIQKRLFTEGALVSGGEPLYEIDAAPYQAAYDLAKANRTSALEAVVKAERTLESSNAALERYEALLELAKVNYQRCKDLMTKNAVAGTDHDQAKADFSSARANLRVAKTQVESDRQSVEMAKAAVKQAEASLESANINLKYTKIDSPIAGRIGRSTVTDGAIATAYQTTALATVQQLDPIYVDVPQSTVELLRLKRNL
jgi:membrane fusion protein (multidrug efflux system)